MVTQELDRIHVQLSVGNSPHDFRAMTYLKRNVQRNIFKWYCIILHILRGSKSRLDSLCHINEEQNEVTATTENSVWLEWLRQAFQKCHSKSAYRCCCWLCKEHLPLLSSLAKACKTSPYAQNLCDHSVTSILCVTTVIQSDSHSDSPLKCHHQ